MHGDVRWNWSGSSLRGGLADCVRRSSPSERGRRNPASSRMVTADYTEAVIGPRGARTRWLIRPALAHQMNS
jgi:hypothetical protein